MPHLSIRDGAPVVNVKDHTVWARDHVAGPLIAELDETKVEMIYEGVQEDFWRDIAPDIAEEHGFSRSVYSEGRSGGWLSVGRLNFLDYVVDDPTEGPFYVPLAESSADDDTRDEYAESRAERDRFIRFATAIDGAVSAAGEMFVERLQEAKAELEVDREACLIRGEN